MSRINLQTHMKLLKEAKSYFKEAKPTDETALEQKTGVTVLTQEHMLAWLEIFEEDRIMLDGCNFATVKR